jgi:hypothetical protein
MISSAVTKKGATRAQFQSETTRLMAKLASPTTAAVNVLSFREMVGPARRPGPPG